jgi:coatomer subunit beta
LITALPSIKSGKVFRGVLWILGEYVESMDGIEVAMPGVRKTLGEIPIGASERRALEESGGDPEKVNEKETESGEKVGERPKVLADGTYATEIAYTAMVAVRLEAVKAAAKPPLRRVVSCQRCANSEVFSFSLPLPPFVFFGR